MITPEPEENLNRNSLVIGSDIIRHLNESHKDYEITEDLMKKTIRNRSDISPKDFMRSLIFLYIIDLIEIEGFQVKLSEFALRESSQRRNLEEFT